MIYPLSSENESILAVGTSFTGNINTGWIFIYGLSWVKEHWAEMISPLNGWNSNDSFGWSVSMVDSGKWFRLKLPECEYVGVFQKFCTGNTDWEFMG